MIKPTKSNDALNKAINFARGLHNPPGITGRHAQIRYSPYASIPEDQDSLEMYIKDMLGLPDGVTVIVIGDEALAPTAPAEISPVDNKRLMNLAKAQAARAASLDAQNAAAAVEAERQRLINEKRIENLKKARKKKGR